MAMGNKEQVMQQQHLIVSRKKCIVAPDQPPSNLSEITGLTRRGDCDRTKHKGYPMCAVADCN